MRVRVEPASCDCDHTVAIKTALLTLSAMLPTKLFGNRCLVEGETKEPACPSNFGFVVLPAFANKINLKTEKKFWCGCDPAALQARPGLGSCASGPVVLEVSF